MQSNGRERKKKIIDLLDKHPGINQKLSRKVLIQEVITNKEAIIAANGALATWTRTESTGRSPMDTVIVKRPESEQYIDWTSANNLPIDPETFDIAMNDALELLLKKNKIYVEDRVVGADSHYAMPVKTISDKALTMLFADNMFRPVPADINKSVFHGKDFHLLVLPYDKLDNSKYEDRLRKHKDGTTTNMIVAMDLDNRIGVIIGSAYLGSVKKLIFTVMNYYLPFEKVLPLHCSANEGKNGDSALMLGLSGTGKTTLSADPNRALLGDDEHGWSEEGIFNYENGCYAKMIGINPKKEPEIYDAVMHEDDYLNHGAIVENAMIYPNGVFDYDDERFSPNSRASYPLTFLKNVKASSVSGVPSSILFLTADAYGVLPPISKLNTEQAMLWFMMGYTSKLAGTETGVVSPVATFSRFFGQPFMPCNPDIYAGMLGKKLEKFRTNVFLINTGWNGGPYGVGKRIDLPLTRRMLDAALNGELDNVEYSEDTLFHLQIPHSCPGVPTEILDPINTWSNKEEYQSSALKLAEKFSRHFDKAFSGSNIHDDIIRQCPGK